MLDVARIIRRNAENRFDTVFFFDKNPEYVVETQKRIPGALGFTGDFVEVVLSNDPEEASLPEASEALQMDTSRGDTITTRRNQTLLSQRRTFLRCFPFDVVNLDLEEFLFKASDPFPGKVMKALRKMLEWQRRSLPTSGISESLEGFSLMFTTQVGPPDLRSDYRKMLRDSLTSNLKADRRLKKLLIARGNGVNAKAVEKRNFKMFFTLAMPKLLMRTLLDEDWYVDPESGITTFEFQRRSTFGAYTMLHIVMDVKRQKPTRDSRAPLTVARDAERAYREVAFRLFNARGIEVTDQSIDPDRLQRSLNEIKARRQMYLDGKY